MVHMNLVKKLAAGLQITWRDLMAYKALDRADGKLKEWQFAPVLVSSNRERLEIIHHKAILFAKLLSSNGGTLPPSGRTNQKIQAICMKAMLCSGSILCVEVKPF